MNFTMPINHIQIYLNHTKSFKLHNYLFHSNNQQYPLYISQYCRPNFVTYDASCTCDNIIFVRLLAYQDDHTL